MPPAILTLAPGSKPPSHLSPATLTPDGCDPAPPCLRATHTRRTISVGAILERRQHRRALKMLRAAVSRAGSACFARAARSQAASVPAATFGAGAGVARAGTNALAKRATGGCPWAMRSARHVAMRAASVGALGAIAQSKAWMLSNTRLRELMATLADVDDGMQPKRTRCGKGTTLTATDIDAARISCGFPARSRRWITRARVLTLASDRVCGRNDQFIPFSSTQARKAMPPPRMLRPSRAIVISIILPRPRSG